MKRNNDPFPKFWRLFVREEQIAQAAIDVKTQRFGFQGGKGTKLCWVKCVIKQMQGLKFNVHADHWSLSISKIMMEGDLWEVMIVGAAKAKAKAEQICQMKSLPTGAE